VVVVFNRCMYRRINNGGEKRHSRQVPQACDQQAEVPYRHRCGVAVAVGGRVQQQVI